MILAILLGFAATAALGEQQATPAAAAAQAAAAAAQAAAAAATQAAVAAQAAANAATQAAEAARVAAAAAQVPGAAAAQPPAVEPVTGALPVPAGLRPPWEASKTIEQLQAPLQKLNGALSQVRPQDWQGTGASNYVEVVESARQQVRALLDGIAVISAKPDRLSNVVRLFIALQRIETPIDSVVAGANQYSDYDSAHAIEEALVALLNQRENLVTYLLELSEFNETSTTLGQRELESCRRQLAQQAPPGRPGAKK